MPVHWPFAFEAISAVSQAVVAAAVAAGVVIARGQLKQSQVEKVQSRKLELVLDLVGVVGDISREIRIIRYPVYDDPSNRGDEENNEILSRRIGMMNDLEPALIRLEQLSAIRSGLNIAVDVDTDLQDFKLMVADLRVAQLSLLEGLGAEKSSASDHMAFLSRQDAIAFAPRNVLADDEFGRDFSNLSRNIINGHFRYLNREGLR